MDGFLARYIVEHDVVMLIPPFRFLEVSWQTLSVVAQGSEVRHLVFPQQAVSQFQGAVVSEIKETYKKKILLKPE